MLPLPGGGECDGQALHLPRRHEPRHEVGRQEGRIPRDADDRRQAAPRRVVETGEDAGQRPRMIWQIVRQYRSRKVAEARRIAVGAERQTRRTLRRQPLDHPRQQRAAAEHRQRLVAPAHAPRQPPREDEAEHGRRYSMTMRGGARPAPVLAPPVRFVQSAAAMER